MSPSKQLGLGPMPLPRTEQGSVMVKAAIRKPENGEFKAQIGQCIERAYKTCGWNLDEFSQRVGRDSRQVKRWIDGSERPQFDALFAIEEFHAAVLIEFARMSDRIEVVTEMRVRRSA